MGVSQSKEKFYKRLNPIDLTYPIYWDAYGDYYKNLWYGINEVYKNDLIIKDLCYFHALSCFYFDTEEDYLDRQLLLYHYLKPSFNWKDQDSILNKNFDILPIESTTKINLSNICTAYDDPPSRLFSNTISINQEWTELYNNSAIDSQMQDIYELAKLCNVVLVAPIFKEEEGENRLKLHIMSPDGFRVKCNPNNQWQIQELIYPDYGMNNEIIYHVWTDTSYFIKDREGKISVEEMTNLGNADGSNPYGKIPYVLLKLRKGKELIDGGKWAMIQNNLRNNKTLFGSELISTLTAFPIPFGINIESGRISPDIILGAKANLTTEDVTPDFHWISPETVYNDLLEFYNSLSDLERQKLGIPQDSANESGIARIISRQRLIEERIRDLAMLANFEKELANMALLVGSTDGYIKNEPLNFGINYAEERLYIEPEIERAQDWERVEKGEIRIENYYKKWGDFDTNITITKLKSELEKRLKNLDEIKIIIKNTENTEIEEVNNGLESTPDTNGFDDGYSVGMDTASVENGEQYR